MANTRELSQLASVISVADETRNVGIGTTNPTSKLHVIGDVRVSGIITASSFVGALTGTATSTTNIPNLTGAITSNNTTTSLGSFTSAQLATALTDETGSGSAVFATSPTLVTPVLGSATATSVVVGSGVTINASGINASGIVTALGGVRGIGIYSGGNLVTTGIITALNFIGTGNTFFVTNNKIDISISGGSQVSIGTESPASPSSGNLWYNTNLGRTFIYYNDGDSSQWVDAAPFNIVSDSGGSQVSVGTEAPVGPTSGDLWYNADYARIFVYYDNGINSQWVDAAPFNYAVVDVLNISGSGYVLGNLGIGTTNPTSKLHVVGDTLISGVTTSQNGFTSGIGVTNPVKIAVSGNTLTFTVVGVGSTSLRLY